MATIAKQVNVLESQNVKLTKQVSKLQTMLERMKATAAKRTGKPAPAAKAEKPAKAAPAAKAVKGKPVKAKAAPEKSRANQFQLRLANK
jgi:hypothetical protein